MKNVKLLASVLLLGCLASCGERNNNGRFNGALEEIGYPMQADSVNLVKMDESVFGEAILLKGEYIPIEPLIKPAELEAFVKDSLLFLKHLEQREGEPLLHVFKLPSLEVVAELAKRGNGPAEVMDIRLINTQDSDKYCFVHDVNKNLLYAVDKNFKFHPSYRNIAPKNTSGISVGSSGTIHLSKEKFLFPQRADDGMGIFQMDFSDMMAKGIINLTCSDNLDRVWPTDWTCFTGKLYANLEKKRLVYVYNYYHRVLFSDFDGKNVKVIQFKEQDSFRSSGMWEHMNKHEDTYYYRSAFGSSDYAYLEFQDSSIEGGPVYIEQWTWDGEPVKRYVLEKEMYPYSGCIDEKNSVMYLFDVLQDDFIYKVQMEGEV